ncbi:uncharacterized protein LOC131178470 [Hevea brasiliensis]|uniref:uncharacterized protein LOC131178470 n=1 Tax=Hevea brasiliensis TaxID=3981 RepID=UPI0025EF5DA0|nr:uncharacterized protein LOC131178470 [Hevea brasiliensis]
MARTKRKSPAAAAASSSSSASDDLPVAALWKKLKAKKNSPEPESTGASSDPSKVVKPTVSAPEKKKMKKMLGIDTKRKKDAAQSSGSVDKALLDCKFIKWDYFGQVNFQFKELFEFQEWMTICECTNAYYPRLVQDFYRTLRTVDDEDKFEVVLNDSVYIVSVEMIAKALNLPNDGNKISTHRDVARVPGFNLAEFENEVFPANTATNEKSTSTKAFQHIKIIHSMVNYIFCPKSGSYGYLSYLDMCIMWHIVNKVRMNLAYLIFKNMCKAYGIGKLPYAHLLTALFKELNVNVSKESSRTDLIVLKEIHSDIDGRKKRFEKGGSSSAKVGSDSTNEFMSELQRLKIAVNEQFSTTHQSIELLRKFMDVVDYKVSHLLTQNEELKKLIVDLQQVKETGFPTKVEIAVPANDASSPATQVSTHGTDRSEGNKVGESPAAVAHKSAQVVESEIEPAAEQVVEPEVGPETDVPIQHGSENFVEPESEPAVKPQSEPLLEPTAASTQQKEASLTDHQESAPSQLSAAAAPLAKKSRKRSKSTVSNPYQSLAAALQPPSDEDEAQKHDQLADQGSQPPAAKPTRKKMVPSKATHRSKRLND